ncbi:MAG: heavy-metal-associated domain-containing protein [Mycobacteriaceae bacterium]|nr:heavy-metal-associated domain-containing protein [Mycobacteriaceae bacterium]
MAKAEYRVSGMTCRHCEMSVFREEVSSLAGVRHVEVSAATGELVVTSEEPVADAAVVAAVAEAGYTAVQGDMSTAASVSAGIAVLRLLVSTISDSTFRYLLFKLVCAGRLGRRSDLPSSGGASVVPYMPIGADAKAIEVTRSIMWLRKRHKDPRNANRRSSGGGLLGCRCACPCTSEPGRLRLKLHATDYWTPSACGAASGKHGRGST